MIATVARPPAGFGHTDTPTEAGRSGPSSLDTGRITSATRARDRYDHDDRFPIRTVPAYSRPSGQTLDPAPRASAFACYAKTTDIGHGRKEVRRVWASEDLEWLVQTRAWAGLRSVVLVESERHDDETVTRQRRYFISSLAATETADAERLLGAVRSHWGIENSVHWAPDVVFREDESRARRDHGGANLSVVRRLGLNLLRRSEPPREMSLRMRRKLADWDLAFLAAVVGL